MMCPWRHDETVLKAMEWRAGILLPYCVTHSCIQLLSTHRCIPILLGAVLFGSLPVTMKHRVCALSMDCLVRQLTAPKIRWFSWNYIAKFTAKFATLCIEVVGDWLYIRLYISQLCYTPKSHCLGFTKPVSVAHIFVDSLRDAFMTCSKYYHLHKFRV